MSLGFPFGYSAVGPRTHLEVCGALEGFPADTAAMDTLLPVHLLAVVHEHGG